MHIHAEKICMSICMYMRIYLYVCMLAFSFESVGRSPTELVVALVDTVMTSGSWHTAAPLRSPESANESPQQVTALLSLQTLYDGALNSLTHQEHLTPPAWQRWMPWALYFMRPRLGQLAADAIS